ncbi:MAG: bactofilin family protein [Planctomycetota bacterium]|jgi:cytoskeletal protein CcmA (bactofilin family)
MAETSQEFATIIGPDASFKGDLTFDSAAKVLGKFEGSIKSKGKIHIAGGSACKATISAKEVAVEGHVVGNVEAKDRLDLKPKGRITGDIVAARMSMADGAAIEGFMRIGVNGRDESERAPASTTEVKATAKESASLRK